MSPRPAPTLAETVAAALEWWREAGVDYAYRNEPAPWLADEAPPPELVPQSAGTVVSPPIEPEPPPSGGDKATWPADWAAFPGWWLSEPSLDGGGLSPRVPPRGAPGATLMMLVTMPEAEDREALLSGPQGRLLGAFAQAAGLAAEEVAVASALPRHAPLSDWDALASRGHGEVLLHLLALARPQRLIVFGRGILPLLGHSPAQGAPAVSELSIQGRRLPLLWTYAPENLLKSARERATLWRRWLEWTNDGHA
jgi:DNA polymerase